MVSDHSEEGVPRAPSVPGRLDGSPRDASPHGPIAEQARRRRMIGWCASTSPLLVGRWTTAW